MVRELEVEPFSIEGKVIFIRAYLSRIPIYYVILLKVPAGIIEQLEGVVRDFLFNRG